MANYNVDIEVALRGARELKALKDSLKDVNKEVGRLNAATIKAGKALRGTFSAKDIGNVNNYSKAVAKAERALRNAAFGTEAEKKAVKALVTAQKEFNEQLDRQNKLLREEERLQGVNQPAPKASKTPKAPKASKPGFRSFGISGIDFMPIGGSTNIPGSPLARQAKSQARFGSAISAGAFPLLFGGGPGMALGGALGGAISGSTFGPASIALQVLGGAFDQLAAQAASLGVALNPTTADVDALVQALGLVGSPIQDSISSLEELAGQQVALEAATRQLSIVVGDDGVQALADLGEASTQFGNALTQVTTQVLAQIAKLTGGIVKEIANTVEITALLSAAKASDDPRQKELQEKLAGVRIKPGERGISLERGKIEAEMVEVQRKIRAEEEGRVQAAVERARAGSVEHTIAKNNLAIAKLDGDLTNKRVFDLEKANIFQEVRNKRMQEGADVKLIELERDGQLLELTNRRNAQIESANDKAERAAKRQSDAADRLAKKQQDAADRLAKKQQRAIDRRVEAVKRELERTDKAFDKASSQLDKITQKHKDKMAFEREYSRLIKEGSTPAAAKQAVELKKQLLELDRQHTALLDVVDAQIVKTEFSIADLQAQEGVTNEYKDQVKALDDLKKKRDELKGKKGKAKSAIEEALAVETGRDKIEAEMERIQGVLNKLVDPANQVIAAANAIGDAFSESFKGLITGSMSAQEALRNLFARTADHFADMAAQMIANAIKMQISGIALNFFSSAAGAGAGAEAASKSGSAFTGTLNPAGSLGSGPGFAPTSTFAPPQLGNFSAPSTISAASGAYVSSPTRALIGEGGEPEYVIPESKMRTAMSRYSRGSRGNSVIPESGAAETAEGGGGTVLAAPIDVRYTVERINSVDYVTADQFQTGMQQAAQQGAKQGEQQTLKRLQMSGSTRKRIGI